MNSVENPILNEVEASGVDLAVSGFGDMQNFSLSNTKNRLFLSEEKDLIFPFHRYQTFRLIT
ncbi:MAG: hypothetical protein LIO65_01015 [Odoribacter sp.]|nr:hypothetical protein [Odoribacter sp.]